MTSGISRIEWCDTIDGPWLEMSPVRIGTEANDGGTPNQYVLFSRADQPRLRVDVYSPSGEAYCFHDAIAWFGFLVIGWGECVYWIDVVSRVTTAHPLGAYFGHFYSGEGYLLVASAEALFRFAPDGSIVWQTDVLGIDAVVVHEINDGIIAGDGQWDPPGGWRPFKIELDSGCSA